MKETQGGGLWHSWGRQTASISDRGKASRSAARPRTPPGKLQAHALIQERVAEAEFRVKVRETENQAIPYRTVK